MEKHTVKDPIEPRKREGLAEWLQDRFVSIRMCSTVFFLVSLLVSTTAVIVVLVLYSSGAVTELKNASSGTMQEMASQTDRIVESLSAQTIAILEENVLNVANSTADALAVSQAQVLKIGWTLLDRELSQACYSLLFLAYDFRLKFGTSHANIIL